MPTTPNSLTSSLAPNPDIFERNLQAIEIRSPKAAAQIRSATPSTQVEFSLSTDGQLIGIIDGRALCSKRHPAKEAATWAEQYDPQHCGFIGVIGFGIGHHLAALQHIHQKHSVLLCFEPDTALLRAVLERIDHSQWINNALFLLTTESNDASTLAGLIKGAEAFLVTGVELAPHPSSKKRLEQVSGEFSATLLNMVKFTRTHLVTVLAHSGFTLRNILMNAGLYANAPGIIALQGSCQGRTAILISAGPSLQRNLHLLQDPAIRDRFIIIAVQTMLKPLLKQGIKPHFITALDYHEISKRFYEGLTAQDVEGVRLVVEPKANAAIVEAFPGEILCSAEIQLDKFLGKELARDMGTLPAGATVAHLNYYLARYLGCSTVILIGQDLGFTDGQYYANGASIHQVWAGELSEHRTLEMFEWERIARMKNMLRIKKDIHDRHIFTDEQMSTYIAQFEDDFQQDTQKQNPIRVINATEGGVNIAHTEISTLQHALESCFVSEPINLPETKHLKLDDQGRNQQIQSRMKLVIRQLDSITRNSERVLKLIKKAQSDIENAGHVDRCIAQIHTLSDDVTTSNPGFGLVNFVNQKGALDRFKVDRNISLQSELTDRQRQTKQLDRDTNNVRWTQSSAIEVKKLMERSLSVFQGTASPMTRDEFADEESTPKPSTSSTSTPRRVEAVIFADPEFNALGIARNLAQPIHQGLNALETTIARLGRCTQLDGITIISPMPDRITQIVSIESPLPIRIVNADPNQFRTRAKSIGQARMASSECWRGSIASFGCYDESLEPTILAQVMHKHQIEAAAIIGPDWAMVDPTLVDRIVTRHRADPDRCRILFSQAIPGLGCCVIDQDAVQTLSKAAQSSSVLSSIGAMLSYIPVGPQGDPIASPLCVGIDPLFRDAGVRMIADSTIRIQAMAAAYKGLGNDGVKTNAAILLKAFVNELNIRQHNAPARIQLELTTTRIQTGLWATMHNTPANPMNMDADQASNLINQARILRDECSIIFSGRGDPLTHPHALNIIQHATEQGITNIELRTDLINQPYDLQSILTSGISVLSVDVLADTESTYHTMTGQNTFETLLDTMQTLFNTRSSTPSILPTPWIVPRITRCDATYPDIQGFYDRWLTVCGCAIIDPHPPKLNTEDRIKPLYIPDDRALQLAANTLRIQADGQVINHLGEPIPNTNAFELGIEQSYKNFRQSLDQSTESNIEPKTIQEPAPIT